ncbi:MAG: hypothetical protein FD149_2354 [Rhodospirillaceae bacterium]|nr:MAG: hypothetical protein FD149_2354 [Rhodospirillaceae bacterium]
MNAKTNTTPCPRPFPRHRTGRLPKRAPPKKAVERVVDGTSRRPHDRPVSASANAWLHQGDECGDAAGAGRVTASSAG